MTLIKATSHIKRGTQTLVLWMMFIIITCICYKNSNMLFTFHYVFFVSQHNKTDPGSAAFSERWALEHVTITLPLDQCWDMNSDVLQSILTLSVVSVDWPHQLWCHSGKTFHTRTKRKQGHATPQNPWSFTWIENLMKYDDISPQKSC